MTRERPTLTTRRLVLRPFTDADAPRVAELAGAAAVADTTLLIPHPYELHHAREWIAGHAGTFERGDGLELAVDRGPGDGVIGALGLRIDAANERGDVGYWIGVPYWGRGYATEAAAALVAYGFATLGLHRLTAHHFRRNPASGRVLEKVGMRHEGAFRHHILKNGRYEDIELYGMLRSEHAPKSDP